MATSLRDRFRDADLMPAPDLWLAATSRAAEPAPIGATEPFQSMRRGWRRVATVAVAIAIAAVAAVFVWRAFDLGAREGRVPATPLPSTPSPVALDALPQGWSRLPFAPPDVRALASSAWTGRELVVWGGYIYTGFSDEQTLADGYRFDPETGRTTPISRSPLSPRFWAADAWTGDELLVWGGLRRTNWNAGDSLVDGAAYDPAADRWRTLAAAPEIQQPVVSAWHGSELFVWSMATGEGAAYDPDRDRWRPIGTAVAPLGQVSVSLDDAIILFPGDDASAGATATSYDAVSDSWTPLPPVDIARYVTLAAAVGDRVYAWSYAGQAIFDLTQGRWVESPPLPTDSCEGGPDVLAPVGDTVLGRDCVQWVLWGQDGRWQNVSDGGERMSSVEAFEVDGVTLVAAYSERYAPGAPVGLYAFRPPADLTCGAFGDLEGGALAQAVAGRFGLLRGGDPGAVLPELRSVASAGALSPYGDTALRPLIGPYFVDEVVAVDPVGEGTFEAVIRWSGISGGAFSELLTLRAAQNASGDGCPMVVDAVAPLPASTEFVPPWQREGDRIRTTLAFPDGTRGELTFPVELRLLVEGVQPSATVIAGETGERSAVRFVRGPVEAARTLVLPGSVGEATTSDGSTIDVVGTRAGGVALMFALEEWTVLVEAPDVESATALAASLSVSEDDLGFPIVATVSDLAIDQWATLTLPHIGSEGVLDLILGPCPGQQGVDEATTRCLAEGRLAAAVTGSDRFAAQLEAGLTIENFSSPSP